MGGTGSSSKAKSLKKKRKRSRSKKKSWRKESKRRRHDSLSFGSEDDLSDSVRREKSSRSKSGHKIRKRKDRKLRRNHSNSSDSDYHSIYSDSGSFSSIEKERRSRKSRKVSGRSKINKKRARKRDSSFESDSGEYTSRKRKRLEEDHAIIKRKKSSKNRSRKYVSKSSCSDSESCSTCRSRSSCSAEDDNTQWKRRTKDDSIEYPIEMERYGEPISRSPSQEKHTDQSAGEAHYDMGISVSTNSRRLRSVIAVADKPCGEMESEKDLHRAEIMYDQEDDYPSPRSVDFDSDENQRRTGSGYHPHDISVETGKSSHGHLSENDGNESMENVVTTASVEDDTESILRQRALENFRKFKADFRSIQKCQQTNNGHDANGPASTKVAETQNTSTIQSVSDSSELKHSADLVKRDVQESSHGEHAKKDPQFRAENLSSMPSLPASSEGKVCSSPASSENPVPVDTTIGSTVTTAQAEPSSTAPISQEPNKERDKPKDDDSQFEQKTMTVMRGGEMVEVTYKVHIPKRPPALARRQLRR